jgi:hypothetical protein
METLCIIDNEHAPHLVSHANHRAINLLPERRAASFFVSSGSGYSSIIAGLKYALSWGQAGGKR